jgi:hypothetical protein
MALLGCKSKEVVMKRNLLCLTLLFLLFLLQACGSEQVNVSPGADAKYTPIYVNYTSTTVKNAAETGLPTIIESLKGGSWASFGFLSKEELDSAQLGIPYHVFAMTNAGKTNQTIIDTDEWQFPVMVNNDYRCLLMVDKLEGEFKTASIGSAGLATWLQAAERSHHLLDLKAKGIVVLHDHATDIMMINPSQEQPSFLLPPYTADMVKSLPQYSNWVNSNPVPALSFEEIFLIYSGSNANVVSLNQQFTVKVGQEVSIPEEGLILALHSVAEDSRCPEDAACISEGNAKVRIDITKKGQPSTTIELNTSSVVGPAEETYQAYTVKLTSLAPKNKSGQTINSSDYIASLLVYKN